MTLALTIDSDATKPLTLRLAEALIEAIKTGQLKAGEAMPSTRVLSATLSVAPLTVHRAYQDLLSRGYVETVAGSGTFVRHLPAGENSQAEGGQTSLAQAAQAAHVDWSHYVREQLAEEESLPQKPDLFAAMYQSLPTREQLPLAAWSKLLVKHGRNFEQTLDYSGDAFGAIKLRQALADYLRRARGTTCSWDQIAIFSGSQQALDLVCRALIDRGDRVAMENPGYFGARRTFTSHGAQIAPIPIDDQGISVEYLKQLPQTPKLVFVTPSHQDPLGITMTEKRRDELVAWARAGGAIIIEDDNDCEYRHGARPLPSLQGRGPDCVIYLSTFWRTLASLVRIGYMVVPRRLEQVFTFVKSITARDFPMLEQCALGEFIEQGHLERHIHKTGAIYKKRLHALTHALTVHLKDTAKLERESGGMRVLAHFNPAISNEKILECAYESEFPLYETNNYYLGEPKSGEFLIPFGQFDEATLSDGVSRFASLLLRP